MEKDWYGSSYLSAFPLAVYPVFFVFPSFSAAQMETHRTCRSFFRPENHGVNLPLFFLFYSCIFSSKKVLYILLTVFVSNDAWLSLVERCVRDAEVAGSNPVASIKGIMVCKKHFERSAQTVDKALREIMFLGAFFYHYKDVWV